MSPFKMAFPPFFSCYPVSHSAVLCHFTKDKKQDERGKKIEILYLKREVKGVRLLFSSISGESYIYTVILEKTLKGKLNRFC